MRRSLIVSLLFHAGVAGLVVGLSRLTPELPQAETPVTVEIVAEPAAEAPAPSPQPPRPPAAEAAPVPQRQAAAPPPPPPAPKAEPEAQAKAKPLPPPPPPPAPVAAVKPEPPPPPKPAAAKPEPAPPPEPAPERADAKPPPPRPQPRKPEPPPKPATTAKPELRTEVAKAAPKPEKPASPPAEKSETSDFDALLRSVEAQTKRVQAPEKRAGKGVAVEAGGTGRPGEAPTAQVNPSLLVAAVSRQVTPCWNIPIAAQGVSSLRAELAIELGPDGAVQTVAPTDTARMASDPVFRAFAESAVRAVRSCSPLQLPPESYQVWRTIIFNFEPSMMAG